MGISDFFSPNKNNEKIHLTVAAMFFKDDKVLIIQKADPAYKKKYSIVAGHVEEGEDNLTAAKREIYEESGVSELELIEYLGEYQRYRISKKGSEDISELKIIHLYLFKTTQTELKPVDPENPEAIWVDKFFVVNYLTHHKDREFYLSIVDKIN